MYEMLSGVLHFNTGDTVPAEDLLAAGCDLAWLERAKAIQRVGFAGVGPVQTDEQHAAKIAELHALLNRAEEDRDEAREGCTAAGRRIRALEATLTAGQAQYQLCLADLTQTAARLRAVEAERDELKSGKAGA